MFRLDEKTALVTGASQGIGAAVARRLAAQGARVVVAARNVGKLETLAGEIADAGGHAVPLPLDLEDTGSIADRISSLPKELGGIDVLINNAGITQDNLLARMKTEEWERVLRVNLTGAFVTARAVVRDMMKKRWGRIVNVSSVVGLMGNVGQANYAASKAGLIGFCKSMAREVASRGITVNVVAPGLIETDMTRAITSEAHTDWTAQIPLGRPGTPEDVAAAACWLASQTILAERGAQANG